MRGASKKRVTWGKRARSRALGGPGSDDGVVALLDIALGRSARPAFWPRRRFHLARCPARWKITAATGAAGNTERQAPELGCLRWSSGAGSFAEADDVAVALWVSPGGTRRCLRFPRSRHPRLRRGGRIPSSTSSSAWRTRSGGGLRAPPAGRRHRSPSICHNLAPGAPYRPAKQFWGRK